MIETFKILRGVYDPEVASNILVLDETSRTRGNDLKLKKFHCNKNIRKYSFTRRITDTWNSLPNKVINAKSVKHFEIALDRHWEHQDVKFDYTADINTQEVDIVADTASAH
ncbi:hypothetical protein FSP39_022286 [Pinctada imbricata]|uniref:Uncharacterized protein n=1 Tax=Pinctada imbricata TaxID=66713 RepID=A0AA88XSK1_PINIB|nr:hypothetical protein FSP39_022286 [Pinctada imbricata]